MPTPLIAAVVRRRAAPLRRSRSPAHAPFTLGLALACLLVAAPRSAAQDASNEDLAQQLQEALARIAELTRRVAVLESGQPTSPAEDDLEAQLQRLLAEDPPPPPPPRTVFPNATNPQIGVFVDALVDAGDAKEKLGTPSDRFSLRETEVDFRLAISPFADGVLVTTFADAGGGGAFDSGIEEGYANISLGSLLDVDTAATLKLGRFRAGFGAENRLHTHDQMQADRPFVLTRLFGDEGLVGDGLEATLPLWHSGEARGEGNAVTAHVAVVNGDVLTGESSPLSAAADTAGLTLSSDAPLLLARVSDYMELDELSDLEFGASYLTDLRDGAVQTSAGTTVQPRVVGVDLTWRQRDDETGQGSWLVAAEAMHSQYDYGAASAPGFPVGQQTTSGWTLSAQRQSALNTYVGLRVGKADNAAGNGFVKDVTPYVTWYADEFFRLRLQAERLWIDGPGGNDTVNRALFEATWNFGAHMPHPYWTNK